MRHDLHGVTILVALFFAQIYQTITLKKATRGVKEQFIDDTQVYSLKNK